MAARKTSDKTDAIVGMESRLNPKLHGAAHGCEAPWRAMTALPVQGRTETPLAVETLGKHVVDLEGHLGPVRGF